MKHDWRAVHLEALNETNEVTGANYFRSCGIPGSQKEVAEIRNARVRSTTSIDILCHSPHPPCSFPI